MLAIELDYFPDVFKPKRKTFCGINLKWFGLYGKLKLLQFV